MDLSKIGGSLSSFAPAAGVVTSLVGSIFGNKQSKDNVKYQMEMQRRENALNREFNMREAEKNRLFQQSQIMDYRRYNSPVNQARLMEEAGYHPMSALGQFGNIDAGLSTGSQASSNGSISPVGYQPLDLASTSRIMAETEVLKSQARKNNADADDAEARAATENLLRDGAFKLQNVQVDLNNAKIRMTQEQADMFTATASQMNKTVEHIQGLIDKLKWETKSARWQSLSDQFDYVFKYNTTRSAIDAFNAENDYKMSVYDYKKAVAWWTAEFLNLRADTSQKFASAFYHSEMGKYYRDYASDLSSSQSTYYDVQGLKLHYENKELKIWSDFIEDNPDYVKTMKIADGVIDKVGRTLDMINPLSGAKNAFKPAPRHSTSYNHSSHSSLNPPREPRRQSAPRTFSIRRGR